MAGFDSELALDGAGVMPHGVAVEIQSSAALGVGVVLTQEPGIIAFAGRQGRCLGGGQATISPLSSTNVVPARKWQFVVLMYYKLRAHTARLTIPRRVWIQCGSVWPPQKCVAGAASGPGFPLGGQPVLWMPARVGDRLPAAA